MYCPKCGTPNTDTASFCRGCGANVALVPQALTGALHAPIAVDTRSLSRRERRELERERKRERERRKPPSVEGAIVPFFGGIGFICVALAVMLFMPGGYMWGFWMFIPAFFMMGSGIAQYVRLKESRKLTPPPAYAPPAAISSPATTPAAELQRSARTTSDIYAPGSVTEGTTKLLDREQ